MRYALRLGGLLIVLAGLFAMHGLDTHGVESAGNVAMSSSAAHGDTGHRAMAGTDAGLAVAMAATSMPAHSGMGGMGAGMCVAVLMLALLALVLEISTRRSFRLLGVFARDTRTPETQGRDPDPPSLIRLSIQRC